MCFSNLPIEFDEAGNPYLAEEADEVDGRPEATCGCGAVGDDVTLAEADPEAMADDILETMPRGVRERVTDNAGGVTDSAGVHSSDGHEQSAGGD